ncbi:nitroreductase family protein [Streptomyces sp. NPDC006540]|uniref:nitroreductase family protein n=1 Tax=Streptomyces sp. NPDC006540 TaxID=3155353 RepID=UPI0033B03DFE
MTAPTAPRSGSATGRGCPVDLPGPEGDNSIAREPLWYAYGAGEDEPTAPDWTWTPEPPPDAHVPPPPPRGRGASTTLPLGTVDLLARMPFPRLPGGPQVTGAVGRAPGASQVTDPLGRALVTAFGPQRREPENPYNDHRSYASPRCLFPVHAFVDGGGEEPWRLLEPDRHALTGAPGPGPGRRIALTGRYTAVPSAYKWFRGSLVAIELGIVLRALSIGLELFGRPARLRLPDTGAHALLDGIGLDRTWEWSLPFVLDVGEPLPAAAAGTAPDPVPPDVTRRDPALADLVRANRSQTYTGDAVPLTTAVPAGLPASQRTPDWAELLWQRHSGRMPRALHGMTGRRRRVPAEALDTALRWLAVPPPGPELAAAFDAVRITVVTQGVDGHEDGVHRAEAATARLFRRDAEAPALLEDHYGYGVSPVNGCGIRNAPMTVFLSVRPRELFARLGPAGWGAAQHACGWAVHGLCLSAAASGLFARPVRAFKEIPVQRVLGLDEDETIVLSAVVGVPQDTGGALLDLRL